MKKMVLTTLTHVLLGVLASPVLAGPPLATDDAGTTSVGSVEIELNGAYGYDKQAVSGNTTTTNKNDLEVKISTGLSPKLSASLAIPYTFQLRSNTDNSVSSVDGFGDMKCSFKYAVTELSGIKFAVKPWFTMPTGVYSKGLSEGRWQTGGLLIATKEIADGKYALHTNIGYEYHRYRTDEAKAVTRNNRWSASVAGEATIVKGLVIVTDVGIATNPLKNTDTMPVYGLAGIRYEINNNLDINAGIKCGLTKPETDVTALYGLILKF